MNPYPDRIAELHDWLRTRYGVADTQAVDILLAATMDRAILRRSPPWIVLETDYPSRDCRRAWFNFGRNDEVARSLSVPRIQRTQVCEEILQSWIDESKATATATDDRTCGIFIDSEWRRLPRVDAPVVWSKVGWRALMTHTYAVLLSRCVRVRTDWPKTGRAALGDDVAMADQMELRRRVDRVSDNTYREPDRRDDAVPPGLFYWCELLQKISPMQQDWDRLIANLVSIARGIATLYGDGRGADWPAVERVMRDTIPYCVDWILRQAGGEVGRADGIKAYQQFRQAGSEFDRLMTNEIRRLVVEGVLVSRKNYKPRDSYTYHPWRYRISSADYKTLIDRKTRILI